MENGTGDSGKVSNGLSLDLLFLARYSTVVAHGWGDALFHCTYNTIFHIILLSPGKAMHFDENITTLKACEHWIFLLTHKLVFVGVESSWAQTSVGRTLLHLLYLLFVTVTSVLAHVLPVKAGICARCSIPAEMRQWQILVTQIPGILSGDEIFCNTWGRICPFLCGRWHLRKHPGLEVSGREKRIPLSPACSQCFKTELL